MPFIWQLILLLSGHDNIQKSDFPPIISLKSRSVSVMFFLRIQDSRIRASKKKVCALYIFIAQFDLNYFETTINFMIFYWNLQKENKIGNCEIFSC